MDIDHATIKAVSAGARRQMLKSLSKRKKMPSELSKETGLSPSTVVGHLQNLECAGLIRRVETGHKWVYYELTDKGINIVQPRIPMQFALSLAIGAVIMSFGALKFLYKEGLFGGLQQSGSMQTAIQSATESAVSGKAAHKGIEIAASGAPLDWLSITAIIIGAALILLSIYKLRKAGV